MENPPPPTDRVSTPSHGRSSVRERSLENEVGPASCRPIASPSSRLVVPSVAATPTQRCSAHRLLRDHSLGRQGDGRSKPAKSSEIPIEGLTTRPR